MLKLTLVKKFVSANAIGNLGNYLVIKSLDGLTVFSATDLLPIVKSPDLDYVNRLIPSPDKRSLLAFSTLFSDSVYLYAVPSLKRNLVFQYKGKGILLLKDACFSPDSTKLYLLADEVVDGKAESILIRKNLKTSVEEIFFENSGLRFNGLKFIVELSTLALFGPNGEISFFQGGSLVHQSRIENYHKAFFIEQGHLILTDTKLGFNLISHNGKIIQRCDFLIPVPLKPLNSQAREFDYKETYADIEVSNKRNLILYLTVIKPENKFRIYVFSSLDFSLLKKMSFNEVVYGIDYQDPYLFVRTDKGTFVFLFKDKENLKATSHKDH